jgi:hypothetical protein
MEIIIVAMKKIMSSYIDSRKDESHSKINSSNIKIHYNRYAYF